MKPATSIIGAALALGVAGSAPAQPALTVGAPQVATDSSGAPVLVYGGPDPNAHLVVTQQAFLAQPVIVAKEPAVRDSRGNAVGDGSGAAVKSSSAAPMSDEAIAVYQIDRYLLVPSSSAGASSAPSIVTAPAPR